jgi:hypothetical protein
LPEGSCNVDGCEGNNSERVCALHMCGKRGAVKMCAGCAPRRYVYYHDEQCQAAHWALQHRLDCFAAPNMDKVPPPVAPMLAEADASSDEADDLEDG